MNAELIQLLFLSLHVIIFNAACLSATILTSCTLMPLKRSIKIPIIFFIARTLIVYIGVRVFLAHYYGTTGWFFLFDKSIVFLFAALMLLMFYFIFDEEFIKIYLATALSEMIATLPLEMTFFVSGVVLHTDRYRELFTRFSCWDFPIALIYLLLFTLLYQFVKPFLEKYHTWKMKHRRFWIVIVLLYTLTAFSTFCFGNGSYYLESYIMAALHCIAITIVVLSIYRYNHMLYMESNYLSKQLHLVECYFPQLRAQISQMDSSRTIIEAQMQEISHLGNAPMDNARIKAYLSELQHAYEQIKAGIYCDNWLLDSAICYEQSILEQEKIPFSCSIQTSFARLTQADSRQFAQLLLLILDWGIEKNRLITDGRQRFIQIQISHIQNQLFVAIELTCKKQQKFKNKSVRYYLKQHHGQLKQEWDKGSRRILITLPNIG